MANSYLSFTQAAGTSRRKFTYSVWMKRSSIDTSGNYNSGFFNCWSDANNRLAAYFYDNKLYLYGLSGGSANISVRTSRLFRDTSAWYHIVIAVDTTQSTAADRIKFYINGVQETSLDQTTYPAQDHDLPSVGVNAKAIEVGRVNFGDQSTYYYMDGYLSHVAFVDGTALTPTSFGETDSTSGIWKFKSPSGITWGTNGVHLKFENSGALGTDSSGQSNTYTVNGNLKQAIDTPSNVYATWNRLDTNSNATLSNGNTTFATSSNNSYEPGKCTLGFSSGKWYVEHKLTSTIGYALLMGIYKTNLNGQDQTSMDSGRYVYNCSNGSILSTSGGTLQSGLATLTNGDILGIAVDCDNGTIDFYKNGSQVGTTVTNSEISSNEWTFGSQPRLSTTVSSNFGNGFFGTTAVASAGSNGNGSIFEYDVPSGYYALNTKNINTYG